jgi:hypothetical protein
VLLALVAGFVGTTLGLLEASRQAEHARAEAAAKETARAAEAKQRALAEAKEREATDEKGKAVAAAEQERQAKLEADARRQEAERNLAFAKKGNDILGSVFAGLDPKAQYATVAELRNALRDNLAKAVKDLEGSAIGDPLEVVAMQNTLGLSLLGLGEWGLAVAVLEKARPPRPHHLPRRAGRHLPHPGDHRQRRHRPLHPDRARTGESAARREELTAVRQLNISP